MHIICTLNAHIEMHTKGEGKPLLFTAIFQDLF